MDLLTLQIRSREKEKEENWILFKKKTKKEKGDETCNLALDRSKLKTTKTSAAMGGGLCRKWTREANGRRRGSPSANDDESVESIHT
jgi:hypothetical protein